MKQALAAAILAVTIGAGVVPTRAASQVYFYYTDANGSPVAMSDAGGAIVWRADYQPFGEDSVTASATANDKRFLGRQKDAETGFVDVAARRLDTSAGRFVSADRVGAVDPATHSVNLQVITAPQRLNPYAYALNNPYRYVDPDGNTAWDILDVAFFAQSAIDRFQNAAYDLVIDGESYRPRLKPTIDKAGPAPDRPVEKKPVHPRQKRQR